MKMYEFQLKCNWSLLGTQLALVHIMAWRQSGNKPLSEPMMVSLLTHICIAQPQRVNKQFQIYLLHLNVKILWQKIHAKIFLCKLSSIFWSVCLYHCLSYFQHGFQSRWRVMFRKNSHSNLVTMAISLHYECQCQFHCHSQWKTWQEDSSMLTNCRAMWNKVSQMRIIIHMLWLVEPWEINVAVIFNV